MKRLLIAGLLGLSPLFVKAQAVVFRNSVKIAVEAVRVPGDDRLTPTLTYSVGYTRQLAASRWMLEGGLGYINYYKREEFSPFNYYFNGGRSQRVFANFNLKFNLLTSNRHAFRLGAGPSIWYQRNGLVKNLSGEATPDFQNVTNVSFTRGYSHTTNPGLNLLGEYEVAITPEFSLGARAGFVTNLLPPNRLEPLLGTLATAGLSAGYHF